MGIKMSCAECKAKSQDGVMEHLPTCTASIMKPSIGHGLQMPVTIISFSNDKERKKFMKGLHGAFGTDMVATDSDKQTEAVKSAKSTPNTYKVEPPQFNSNQVKGE